MTIYILVWIILMVLWFALKVMPPMLTPPKRDFKAFTMAMIVWTACAMLGWTLYLQKLCD